MELGRGDSQPSAMKRLEFHVIYRCVDRCAFCSEEFHMKEFGGFPIPRQEIIKILYQKRLEGFEHVTLTGGEPTLYPRFWTLAAAAKKMGYRVFVISNGSALSRLDFARRLAPYLDELCLSLHGPNAAVHDGLTRVSGSFDKLKRALENVDQCPGEPFVMINHVVTRLNVAFIKQTLEFVAKAKKVKQFLISNVTPHGGGGGERYSELAVRHDEILSQLPVLAKMAQSSGIALKIYGVPVCLLGSHWRYSNDLSFSPRTTIARARDEDGTVGWHFEASWLPFREKFYPESCGSCVFKNRLCGGVYWDYVQLFGEEKLRPFSASSLRREFALGPIATPVQKALGHAFARNAA